MDKRLILGASIGAAVGAGIAVRHFSTWGRSRDEAERPLPGDDVVAGGTTLLTRGITIDAPPDAVWPWLVQMGYGRGGWYSYDQLDMKGRSAEALVSGFQPLAVGDIVPTHPGGGFVVKAVDPHDSLVLYLDTELASGQARAAHEPIAATETPGLAASDQFLRTATPPDFAVSWAFVLEPIGVGQTRLIERFRGRFGPTTAGARLMLPVLGFGALLMMRKQLIGIRDRAARHARGLNTPPTAGDPTQPDAGDAVEARDRRTRPEARPERREAVPV